MATKTKNPLTLDPTKARENYYKNLEAINGKLLNMRYSDLQIACLERGMEFDLMVTKDIGGLQTWVIKNWDNPINKKRVHEFDKWREDHLKAIGKEGEPFVRLGYLGEENPETGDVEIKKPKKVRAITTKREKDPETGIFSGTKKSLTYQLTEQGLSKEEITAKVKEQFPEAVDKSIHIWIKKCLRAKK